MTQNFLSTRMSSYIYNGKIVFHVISRKKKHEEVLINVLDTKWSSSLTRFRWRVFL